MRLFFSSHSQTCSPVATTHACGAAAPGDALDLCRMGVGAVTRGHGTRDIRVKGGGGSLKTKAG